MRIVVAIDARDAAVHTPQFVTGIVVCAPVTQFTRPTAIDAVGMSVTRGRIGSTTIVVVR